MRGQFVFLMILVIVLVLLFAFQTHVDTCNKFKDARHIHVPSTLDERVEAVIYAMYDTGKPLVPHNKQNPSATYQLWYSNMYRRGLPEHYITPALYQELYALIRADNFSPTTVARAIRPYFDAES